MKYTVNVDIDGYVLSISHTENDNVELDLSDVDLKYLNAYKLGIDSLMLDEYKLQRLVNEEIEQVKSQRIKELKKLLTDSDYICSRAFEEVLSLNNPLTFITNFINILVKYSTQYKDVISNRKAWREEIEELEQ